MSLLELPESWRRPNLQESESRGIEFAQHTWLPCRSFSWKITGHFISALLSSLLQVGLLNPKGAGARLADSHIVATLSASCCKPHLDPGPDPPQILVTRCRVWETIWETRILMTGLKLIACPLSRANTSEGQTDLPFWQGLGRNLPLWVLCSLLWGLETC